VTCRNFVYIRLHGYAALRQRLRGARARVLGGTDSTLATWPRCLHLFW